MKHIYLVLSLCLFFISCSDKLKFEMTAHGNPYGYYSLNNHLVPSYQAIYLVKNYRENKDSLLIKFVGEEFKKANENFDSLMYVSFGFYNKTYCTKKFLSKNPYGRIAIGDPAFGCFDDRINGYYYERISKESNTWIFSDWLNNTTDTIEIAVCNAL